MKSLLTDPTFPPNKPVQMPNGMIYIPLHVAIMQHNKAAEKILVDAGVQGKAGWLKQQRQSTACKGFCIAAEQQVLLGAS